MFNNWLGTDEELSNPDYISGLSRAAAVFVLIVVSILIGITVSQSFASLFFEN